MINDRPTYEEFLKSFTRLTKKGDRRWDSGPCADAYRDMSFEDGYAAYNAYLDENERLRNKIDAFEQFLLKAVAEGKAQLQRSNISESRYYHYNLCTYRFSGHVYPTGSMTRKAYVGEGYGEIDFAADPELIDTINF